MKIILNQDVQNLGEEGDVRDVARGYARNFLFRKDLAVPYNKQSVAIFENKRSAIEKRKEEKRAAAAGMKDKIEALMLELVMPAGDTGKLFGSVTAATLAEELEKQGFTVEKKKIDIPGNTIKMTGEHEFTIRLYENETAACKVTITAEKRSSGKAAPAEKAADDEKVEAAVEGDDESVVEEALEESAAEDTGEDAAEEYDEDESYEDEFYEDESDDDDDDEDAED